MVALQGTNGAALDYQVAFFTRYTRTQFNPDPIGDLLYNGVASQDFHSDVANGIQADTTYRLSDHHTLRAGLFLQQEHAQFRDNVSVFPADDDGNQTSDVPFSVANASGKTGYLYSAYLQDEWKINSRLTINYGVRYDGMDQYVTANQLSPRIGLVFKVADGTTLHAGYSRYFTPPSFELVSSSTIGRYAGTTNASAVTQNDPVQPERDDYFDLGVIQQVGSDLTLGIDGYYKKAHNLLDEGQFGSALIYTPFNYEYGRVYGLELTANYRHRNLSAYLNVALSRAMGKNVTSAQFNFDPDELAYISNHWVNLDHDQRVTISFGSAYTWHQTTFFVRRHCRQRPARGLREHRQAAVVRASGSVGVAAHEPAVDRQGGWTCRAGQCVRRFLCVARRVGHRGLRAAVRPVPCRLRRLHQVLLTRQAGRFDAAAFLAIVPGRKLPGSGPMRAALGVIERAR